MSTVDSNALFFQRGRFPYSVFLICNSTAPKSRLWSINKSVCLGCPLLFNPLLNYFGPSKIPSAARRHDASHGPQSILSDERRSRYLVEHKLLRPSITDLPTNCGFRGFFMKKESCCQKPSILVSKWIAEFYILKTTSSMPAIHSKNVPLESWNLNVNTEVKIVSSSPS